MENLIIPQQHKITKEARRKLGGHKSFVIWFIGLSGSGKSTLSNQLEQKLHEQNLHTYILDGDNIRAGLNKDLGFSEADRKENIRRIGEVAKLLIDAGIIVISAFITPFESDRQMLREMMGKDEFFEVYVKCPLEVCEERDVKGLYYKARQGILRNFTGIDSPFEEPLNVDLEIPSNLLSIEESVQAIMEFIYPLITNLNGIE